MRTDGDYISREAALNLIDFYWQQAYNAGFLDAAVRFGSVYREMEDIPAADVRPVVLCKDCRHRDPEDHKCDCGGTERQGCPFKVADDYFCAYGER